MSYVTVAMQIAILFLASSYFVGSNGEIEYIPKIVENMCSCEGFENDLINCDELVLGSSKNDDGDDTAKLSGKIKTINEIISDYDIEIDVWKILDLADEYMYNTRLNFCSSLDNTDAPWHPILQALNITCCPVPVKTFYVHDMTISLDAVKDILCHDFCGRYRIQISLVNLTDKLSCHILEISIEEYDNEDYE